jgi:arylsulfatase A-like enzyme
MNVILIVSDSLRADHVGCYGGERIHTPHLDRFAQDAVRFERAHCGSFPTVPCRNDIMTGRWTFTYKPWAPLGDHEVVLSETLNKAGYLTALFADTPHPFAPGFNYQHGFQAWELIRGQEHDAWKTAPAAVNLPCSPDKLRGGAEGATLKYLQNVAGRRSEIDYFPARTVRAAEQWLEENRGRPFFLYIDLFDPHEPWDPPPRYLARYEPEGYHGEEVIYPRYDRWASFMTEGELTHCRNLYAGEVSLVDRWIGRLLATVNGLGLAEDTAIIVTADHGFYLGEHGYIGKSLIRGEHYESLPLYPEVSRVPLLIRLPGAEGAATSPAFAQPVDLMPTVLDLLGVPIPGTVQGASLVPACRGGDHPRRFAVSAPTVSGPHIAVPHPTNRITVTTEEWTLILGAQVELLQVEEATAMVDSLARQITFLEGPVGPELYYLPSDPTCTHNILADHRGTARLLQATLVDFLRAVGLRPDHLPYFAAVPPEMRD